MSAEKKAVRASEAELAKRMAALLADVRDLRDAAHAHKVTSTEGADHSLWFVWQAAVERTEEWLGGAGYCVEHGDAESCCLGCDEARHEADEKAAALAEDFREAIR